MLSANALPATIVLRFLIRGNARIRLNKFSWSMQLHSQFVSINEDTRTRLEEAVNVFQCAICSLRVEEVRDGNEGEADHCPDNPELVAQALYTGKSSLNDGIVANPGVHVLVYAKSH